MKIKYLKTGQSNICKNILSRLPEWFGLEAANNTYIENSKSLPMLVAFKKDIAVGFLSLKAHGAYTSEVYVMGVLPEYHREGVGRRLVFEAEKILSGQNLEFLQVKTLAPARESLHYKKTRLFYKSCGFKEVEIFPNLWDESNPCLLLIKSIVS